MTCEDVRLAAMALSDREEASLPREVIEVHLAGCTACRRELEGLTALAQTWPAYARRSHPADLWHVIVLRLGRRRRWLGILVALLVPFRVMELASERAIGLWFHVLPLVAVVVVFVVLRQNPFTIHTELRLHEEEL